MKPKVAFKEKIRKDGNVAIAFFYNLLKIRRFMKMKKPAPALNPKLN